ncbi:hypothetical protein C8J45_103347 [Sphingomonas sp. PP-CE-3G-477]|uniref:hypothetical protein n=1 Tax=Sphingomonas sp. PP-CE-3G-477 TaxID=2135660 RepID=UPI000D372639|nr:hypothetical protein [Sphingomonas sp. PP-CE-3G-477]PTQ64497.1 hypothetical protein C8J45_103347 [Sphingomonas sp. PP-CE-3G-477]
MSSQSTLAIAARRRLVWLLLETFGVNDVHAMLHRSLSGSDMTLEQVRSIRRTMRRKGFDKKPKPSLGHLHTTPIIVGDAEQPKREPGPQPEPKPIAPTVGRAQCPVPESFESQMARLRAGARLVCTPDFRTPPPAFTLGGVGSASL